MPPLAETVVPSPAELVALSLPLVLALVLSLALVALALVEVSGSYVPLLLSASLSSGIRPLLLTHIEKMNHETDIRIRLYEEKEGIREPCRVISYLPSLQEQEGADVHL